MAIKNQLAINYIFEIILGIIVVVVLVSIIVLFKGQIITWFSQHFSKSNNNFQISSNVSNIYSIANYIISCYQHSEQGTCYIIQYTGKEQINCTDLENLVYSELGNSNIVITGCYGNITQYSIIEISYKLPGIIQLSINSP